MPYIYDISGIVLATLAIAVIIYLIKRLPQILLWALSPIWFPFVGCWMLFDSLKRKRRRKQARLNRKAHLDNL